MRSNESIDLDSQYTRTVWYFVEGLVPEGVSHYIVNQIHKTTGLPLENIKYKRHKYSSGYKNVLRTVCHLPPLPNSDYVRNMAAEITQDIDNPAIDLVVVFGHSFGGAIVNRTAELLNKLPNPNLIKLQMASFGSIYFAPEHKVSTINIINYISVSDIAMKCNHLPHLMTLNEMPLALMNGTEVICRLPPNDPASKIKQICLYNRRGEPMCTKGVRFDMAEHLHYHALYVQMYINFHRWTDPRVSPTGLHNVNNIYESYMIEHPDQKPPQNYPYLMIRARGLSLSAQKYTTGGRTRRQRRKRVRHTIRRRHQQRRQSQTSNMRKITSELSV